MTYTQEKMLCLLGHDAKEICDIKDGIVTRLRKAGAIFDIEVPADEVGEMLERVYQLIDGVTAEARRVSRDGRQLDGQHAGKRDSG